MLEIDLSVVTFAPDVELLERLLESLAEPAPFARHLFIEDNSDDPAVVARLRALPVLSGGAFASVRIERSGRNVGFGRAHNANAARGRAPYLLVINPDCIVEPGALAELVRIAGASPATTAAWEMRQIPYEHPKAYDPVTLETPWASGAATLFRREAFEAVGGFDAAIFLYGEDVDLSWRLRAAGWTLTYQPRCAVVHRTYRHPHEEKPVALYEGVLVHLCLRARYAGAWRTAKGLGKLAREIARAPFTTRSRRLCGTALRFLPRWAHFARTRVRPTDRFQPLFLSWDYAHHRDGPFHVFRSRREEARAEPLVSILIRTCGRPAWLREALASCANQTYRNLEVVVVEGGGESGRAVIEEFAGRLDLRYIATGRATTRSENGNLALDQARGEWLNFLDDDDVLFADHVEVLVDAALRAGTAGAYALAWETRTRCHDFERARYEEVAYDRRHAEPFDRMALWTHNYLPIQSVLFHRRLYERHGGFDVAMDQLEDWNLWTRYTLEDDFTMVAKTTSKYRVPADRPLAERRQEALDAAYAVALDRQRGMQARISPREVITMAEAYARRTNVVNRVAARVFDRMPTAARFLRRISQ